MLSCGTQTHQPGHRFHCACRYREYGFIHFKERSAALDAVNKSHVNKTKLDGKELQVRANLQAAGLQTAFALPVGLWRAHCGGAHALLPGGAHAS